MMVLIHAKATVDQAILSLESSNSSFLRYPTQFTQDIMPIGIHSHNDCELILSFDVPQVLVRTRHMILFSDAPV